MGDPVKNLIPGLYEINGYGKEIVINQDFVTGDQQILGIKNQIIYCIDRRCN